MNVNLNWTDAQKSSQGKRDAAPPWVGDRSPTPLVKPKDLLNGGPILHRGVRLPNAVHCK